MHPENSPAYQLAIEQLKQSEFSISDEAIKTLARELKSEQAFAITCQLLGRLQKRHPQDLELGQELAFCTYKNPNEPADVRFGKAIKILAQLEGDLNKSENLETLGLLGAIYKKKWIYNNQIRDLRTSRTYYLRAYQSWIKLKEQQEKQGYQIDILQQDKNVDDNGFNAINTIYLTDLLAYLSLQEARKNQDQDLEDLSRDRLEEANTIRHQLIHYLPPVVELVLAAQHQQEEAISEALSTKLYWLYATLAEAHFGLHEFDQASDYLKKARAIKGESSWEYSSFARQLATLTQIHIDIDLYSDQSAQIEREAKAALKALLNKDAAIEAIFIGKVGLALSGGGFRASLYHIGVLARLAELDVLRHVEVLSCVSGGSIIGAYYYLELKKMLEQKTDDAITQADYIDLVKRIEKQFLKSIQKNLRVRIFGSFAAVFKLIFSERYTTSERLAELYEQYLYRPILKAQAQSLRMDDLRIDVAGDEDFVFARDNWTRKNKIPNLIINATPLNTGHNWQFTASWMGEPPESIVQEVDSKPRLEEVYYQQAPGKFKDIRLGQAVAASSGVPGVIEPLEMDGLYQNDMKVQLVDGGVHDNQGIVGLLAQECQVFFISDASGQLGLENRRLGSILSISARCLNILMERVRDCEYLDLKSRLESSLIKGMMFVHLHKGLIQPPLGWVGMQAPPPEVPQNKMTAYGINRSIQKQLAAMRTDLDAFNDREAYALMYSGYQMTKYQHAQTTQTIFKDQLLIEGQWDFKQVAEEMTTETPPQHIVKQLNISQQTFNKYLGFYPTGQRLLRWLLLVGLLVPLIGALYFFETDAIQQFVPLLGKLVLVLIILLIAPFFLKRIFTWMGVRINTKLFRVALTIFGVFLFLGNQLGSNWLYLKKGKMKK